MAWSGCTDTGRVTIHIERQRMNILLEPTGIVVHHSLWKDRDGLNFPNVKADQIARGWEDCAYHFFLEMVNDQPVIITGRPIQFEGGHTRGHNTKIGICVHGDYDAGQPPIPLIICLSRLILGLWAWYPELHGKLNYHSEYADKSCPGEKFIARKDLLSMVRQLGWVGMQKSH